MEQRDLPRVFLSYTWAEEEAVDHVERVLRRAGVPVFRDTDIGTFDPITEALRGELDSSGLVLAFYSRLYPTRYACQWELTRAYLAARRAGQDPRRRVLVVVVMSSPGVGRERGPKEPGCHVCARSVA